MGFFKATAMAVRWYFLPASRPWTCAQEVHSNFKKVLHFCLQDGLSRLRISKQEATSREVDPICPTTHVLSS
eukprot:g80524.t1